MSNELETATQLSYKEAGVNIDNGNKLVNSLKSICRKTHGPEVLSGIGNFAGLFALGQNYQDPVLVAATDGVGTKLKLAVELGQHQAIGIDLVAMSVNDLLVLGCKPLFFLDYFACGQLEVETAQTVIKGIAAGCQEAEMALIGGETAEMPGIYQQHDYDLAGFAVGIAEREQLLSTQAVKAGDVLIALASSGAHANGYSLIRKIITVRSLSLSSTFADSTLGEVLLKPTTIYHRALQPLLSAKLLKSCAHITGGGIVENLPRLLSPGLAANIATSSWQWPELFTFLQQTGHIASDEMWRTFNCGVGMILCLDANHVDKALQLLPQDCAAWVIGEIIASDKDCSVNLR